MTEPHLLRKAFRPDGFQFAWDATSLSCLKECPAKYEMQILQNWTGKGESPHLTFGTLFHSALEGYHKDVATGRGHDEAVHRAVLATLQASGTRDLDRSGCPQCDGWAQPQVAEGGYQWVCGRCGLTGSLIEGEAPRRFVPWASTDNAKTRENLIRSIVWYFEHYRNDPLKTLILPDGRPAVELSFRFGTGHFLSDGTEIIFCGHIDRLVEMSEQYYVSDYKTAGSTLSSSYFDRYTPDNQMSMYNFAGQIILDKPVAGVIIDAVQIAVGFTRCVRGFAPRTQGQLEEWFAESIWLIQEAERRFAENRWTHNDRACFNCDFKKICAMDPGSRPMFLRSNFQKREGWDPLRVR